MVGEVRLRLISVAGGEKFNRHWSSGACEMECTLELEKKRGGCTRHGGVRLASRVAPTQLPRDVHTHLRKMMTQMPTARNVMVQPSMAFMRKARLVIL